MENQGATVVITHNVLEGKQQEYENWLNEISPISKKAIGFLDWQIIRPIPNLTYTFTVILRFDTIENLKNWIESKERKILIEKALPFFAKDDKYYIKSGLDFLFLSENENVKVPVRWKQFFVTWSAIYPLSTFIPMLLLPLLRNFGFPQNRYIDSFFVSGIIVFIMIYLLMPPYTRLIKKWLYK
ncbi:antibiotic biosynthesis monooxygenase [Flavobacterium granuli]|uniref:Antibiotic biosynthesis monooxygenase (ABM) superfamily enzyme n=1 Tax=Flavobacterium granuli TaxID=280093 RepID=A0ABU1S3X4_9FLAO|nr:antibiotic biosynthesis monooxygenase [Flavobacterium granuli]MDR6845718.1 antibiotic biosynthesis monooxygenase (ABM) superfamily enzyme [Flavobacterium granuli]